MQISSGINWYKPASIQVPPPEEVLAEQSGQRPDICMFDSPATLI